MIKKIYAIIKYFIGYLKDLQIIIKISPKFVFSFFALILFYTAYSQTNDWKNPSVLAIHKEDYHISVVPFPDEQKAFDLEKEKSPYYLSLNGSWKYKFIPDVSFLPVNYKPEFDVNSWDTVQVPGIISQSSSNLKAAGNSSSVNSIQEMTALYSTTFTVPDNWEERQTFVIFEGAGSSFSFWLNGQMAGYSKNNFSPAEFNISSFLKKGVNVLTVRLYLNSHDEFKTLVGGRLGNVYLYSKPNISINNYTVSTDLNQKYKDATIKLSVEIKKLIDRRFKHLSLEASLYDADKHKMFTLNSSELNFIKNGFLKIDLAHNLKNPEKWNTETPYLYTLILTLKDKSGSVIESVAGRVGVRKVEIGNGSLWVNGRRVIIRGINKMGGHSFDKSVMEEEIRRMKQFNMNALRIVGPCTQDLCDLCDEYGIYLCPETVLEATTFNGKTLNDSVWTVSSLDRVKGMVETCMNHPSVISWWLNDKQDHIYSHQNIINWLHQNDPGRPFADLTAVVNSNTDILAPVSPGLEKYLSLRKENKPVIIPYYSGPLFSYLADCDQKQDTSRFDQGGFASEKIGRGFIFKDSIGKAQGNASGFVDENSGIQSDLFVYKHIIQPVKITAFNLKDNKIKIQNCFEAADLSGLKGFWELKDGGTVIQQGELPKLDLPAGMGKVVDIPFTAPAIKPGHEYWLNLYFQLGHNTKFAFQGHEVAWQQFRMPYDSPLSLFTWDKKDKSLDLFENSETYQVTGKDFAVTFGKELGTITSFQFKGKELFKNGPVMDFDDSWENNSTGISKFQKLGLHHLKTVVDKITAVREKTGYVEIRVDKKVYSDSVNYMLDNTVTYGVFPQGDIIVNQNISFQGAYLSSKDLLLSDLGVKMDVPSEFEQCKWFGRGSVADSSNYRNNITKVDAYSSYPMKRDDLKNEGIKSDVRWLTLTDKGGLGFAILGQPVFDAFAIKYPAHTGNNDLNDRFSIVLGYHTEKERIAGTFNHGDVPPVINYCFRFRPIDGRNDDVSGLMRETPYTDAVMISPRTYALKYTEPVSMTCTTKGAEIHFTLDGSEPTFRSPLYTGTFRIIKKASIKARAFAPERIASTVTAADYDVLIPLYKSRFLNNNKQQKQSVDIPLRRICKLGILINDPSGKKTRAVLADARLITRNGDTVYLSDLVPVNYGNSQGKPVNNLAVGGDSITVEGEKYSKGLGVEAPVELWYEIGTDCIRFKVLVGGEKGNSLPSVNILGIKAALKR